MLFSKILFFLTLTITCHEAFAGLSLGTKVDNYRVHNLDDKIVMLVKIDQPKEIFVLDRKHLKSKKLFINQKIFLSHGFQKYMKPKKA
jgi:3-deoxy-D-arabino-heptulosonate 7-phosphate (DAHP) synthase